MKGLKIDIENTQRLYSAKENTQMEIYILRFLQSLYNENGNLNVIKSNDDLSAYKYVR